jgi:hypothetical protein
MRPRWDSSTVLQRWIAFRPTSRNHCCRLLPAEKSRGGSPPPTRRSYLVDQRAPLLSLSVTSEWLRHDKTYKEAQKAEMMTKINNLQMFLQKLWPVGTALPCHQICHMIVWNDGTWTCRTLNSTFLNIVIKQIYAAKSTMSEKKCNSAPECIWTHWLKTHFKISNK